MARPTMPACSASVFLFVGLTFSPVQAAEVFSPKPLTPLFVSSWERRSTLPIEIRDCRSLSALKIQIVGASKIHLTPPRYLDWNHRWDAQAQVEWATLPTDRIAVDLSFRCGSAGRVEQRRINLKPFLWEHLHQVTNAIIASFIERYPAHQLAWSWGEGVLLWSLLRRQEQASTRLQAPILVYLDNFYRRYRNKKPPKIDRPDLIPPALTAEVLSKTEGRAWMRSIVDPTYQFLRHERRTGPLETLNHLGETSILHYFYPRSVWLDSLMMYALPASVIGASRADRALESWANEQPAAFRELLEDPADHLYHHGYFVSAQEARPQGSLYWLRGNGWVAAATSEMVRRSESSRDRLSSLLEQLWASATPHLLPSGLWGSLILEPESSSSEVSGTALLALGGLEVMQSAEDLDRIRLIAQGIASRFAVLRDGADPRYSVSEISSHTNVSNRFGYQIVAQRRDLPYGVGAVILFFHELERAFHGWNSEKH